MKIKYLLIPLFCLSFLSVESLAQEIPLDFKQRVNDAEYIFEGKVIKSTSYYTQDSSNIYTSNTVEVSKIFKGELTCGTVEIITLGGTVGNITMDVTHTLQLLKGNAGVFLCSPTDRDTSTIDFYPETNDIPLEPTFESQSFLKYWYDGIDYRVSDYWFKRDSLQRVYDDLIDSLGLSLTNCNNADFIDGSSNTTKKHSNYKYPSYKKEDFQDIMNKSFKLGLNISEKQDSIFERLTYTLSEGEIEIINGEKHLNFNVLLNSLTGETYFDNGLVRLEYDTTIFGSHIVDSSSIEVTRGTVISDTSNYLPPIPGDMSSNEVAIPLSGIESPENLHLLSTNATIAVNVRMKIKNCTDSDNEAISFTSQDIMAFLSNYAHKPNDTTSYPYDEIVAEDMISLPPCEMKINDFSPGLVFGGVDDILTIEGQLFGETKGNGTVMFKNADDGGQSEVFCDDRDIISWNDSIIRISVPSYDTATVDTTTVPGAPAGSGIFRVVNDAGDTASSNNPLTIFYSIRNNSDKNVVALAPRTVFNQKYILRCSPAVSNYPGMKATINKALKDWKCLTGIDWELGSDTLLSNPSKADSICYVYFDNLSGNTAATTTSIIRTCNDSSGTIEFNIRIDSSVNWYVDTTASNPPGSFIDFYTVILHELGHAHELNHIIDPAAIMHYVYSGKKINLQSDGSCDQGGNWIISDSKFKSYPAACYMEPINQLVNPCGNTGIKDSPENRLVISPNPSSNILKINLDEKRINQPYINIQIFNTAGKLVQSKRFNFSNNQGVINLNISELNSGIYVGQINLPNRNYNFKFIKN